MTILLGGISSTSLIACSCDPISFDDAIEYADEIFVGKIIKVERFKNGKFINTDNQEVVNWDWSYEFAIRKKWKGNRQSKLIVYHQGNSCDLWFDIYEREYLVYASRKTGTENPLGITIEPNNGKDKLTTWLCSRTVGSREWEEGNWFTEDIEKLDQKFPSEIRLSRFQMSMAQIMVLVLVRDSLKTTSPKIMRQLSR